MDSNVANNTDHARCKTCGEFYGDHGTCVTVGCAGDAVVTIGPFDRKTLIAALIESDIQVNGGERDWFLASLLGEGCRGYHNLSDDELEDYRHKAGLGDDDVLRYSQQFKERGL